MSGAPCRSCGCGGGRVLSAQPSLLARATRGACGCGRSAGLVTRAAPQSRCCAAGPAWAVALTILPPHRLCGAAARLVPFASVHLGAGVTSGRAFWRGCRRQGHGLAPVLVSFQPWPLRHRPRPSGSRPREAGSVAASCGARLPVWQGAFFAGTAWWNWPDWPPGGLCCAVQRRAVPADRDQFRVE